MLEQDLRRQVDGIPRRHHDELRVPTIAVMPDHLSRQAELLAPRHAVRTSAAGDQIVETDAVAGRMRGHPRTERGDFARDLVPERDRRPERRRATGPVVGVGVTDTRGSHPDEHLARTRGRRRNVDRDERLSYGIQTKCAHGG